jgi:hypothetical protein
MVRSDKVESDNKTTNLGYNQDLKYDKIIQNKEILEKENTKVNEIRLLTNSINHD